MYGTRQEKLFEGLTTKGIIRIRATHSSFKGLSEVKLLDALASAVIKGVEEIMGGLARELKHLVRQAGKGENMDEQISEAFKLAHISVNRILTVSDAKSGKSWLGDAMLGGD